MLCTSGASPQLGPSLCNHALRRITAKDNGLPIPIFGAAPTLVFFIAIDTSVGVAIAVETVAPAAYFSLFIYLVFGLVAQPEPQMILRLCPSGTRY